MRDAGIGIVRSPGSPYMSVPASVVNVGESRAHSRFAVPNESICTLRGVRARAGRRSCSHLVPPPGCRPVPFRHTSRRGRTRVPNADTIEPPGRRVLALVRRTALCRQLPVSPTACVANCLCRQPEESRVKGQVAALVGRETVELKEFDVPEPEPGAVVLQVTRANVCGSDVHIYHYESPLLRQSVLGHEFVGRIHALGAGVTTDYAGEPVAVGDRVVAVYFLACRRCPGCQRGEFSLCRNSLRLWARPPEEPPHFFGGFATHYYVDPEQYFYKVPETLSDEAVAGANCGLAQMLFALDRIGLHSGESIVIQGAGGLGLYAAAVARDRGARVYVVDSVPERLELARAFGAHAVVDMKEHTTLADRVARVQELTGSDGADVVLEVTGVAAAFPESVELAGVGGRIASVGNINVGPTNEVSIAPGLVTRKNLTVRGFLRYDPWYLRMV